MSPGWHNLQYLYPDGGVLYLNHLFGILGVIAFVFYFCYMVNHKTWDKVLHCTISAALTIALIVFFNAIKAPWAVSPILVLLIGVGKEVIDRLNVKKRLFDLWDLLADVVGLGSVTVFYLFSFFLYVEM